MAFRVVSAAMVTSCWASFSNSAFGYDVAENFADVLGIGVTEQYNLSRVRSGCWAVELIYDFNHIGDRSWFAYQ